MLFYPDLRLHFENSFSHIDDLLECKLCWIRWVSSDHAGMNNISCEISIFYVSRKQKKKERENWKTTKLLFKTCIKTIFMCKKIKENVFWTGSREDRSQRERRSTRFALVKACFLKMCSKISKKIWSGTTELRSEIFKRKKICGLFCALAILQS